MITNFADHAANERTFLAWVRTVMAVVGFGLAAARLGNASAGGWTEPVLLAAGALVIVLAFIRMRRIRRRIDTREHAADDDDSADAWLMLVVVALFGLLGAFSMHVR